MDATGELQPSLRPTPTPPTWRCRPGTSETWCSAEAQHTTEQNKTPTVRFYRSEGQGQAGQIGGSLEIWNLGEGVVVGTKNPLGTRDILALGDADGYVSLCTFRRPPTCEVCAPLCVYGTSVRSPQVLTITPQIPILRRKCFPPQWLDDGKWSWAADVMRPRLQTKDTFSRAAKRRVCVSLT